MKTIAQFFLFCFFIQINQLSYCSQQSSHADLIINIATGTAKGKIWTSRSKQNRLSFYDDEQEKSYRTQCFDEESLSKRQLPQEIIDILTCKTKDRLIHSSGQGRASIKKFK